MFNETGFLFKGETIVVTPKEKTLKERQMDDLDKRVGEYLESQLSKSNSLADFILYYCAVRSRFYSGGSQWLWDYGTPTFDDALNTFVNDQYRNEAKRDAKVAEELTTLTRILEDKPDYFKMTLKRIRDQHNYYKYGVLTEFPKGIQAGNPVQGYTPLEQTLIQPDLVYFRPTSPCVLHACDDLYKIYRQSPFYVPYRDRSEAQRRIRYNGQGVNEYQLEKNQEEVVKQEAENYILVGVHFAFSNELFVAPISRFV